MFELVGPLVSNMVRASMFGATHVRPLFPLYHITPFCNLRCTYCEGFPEVGLPGAATCRHPGRDRSPYELDASGVKRLLRLLRAAFDCLFVTGGEPLVRDDIVDILSYAKELRFRHISLNTNGVLLHQKEAVLPYVSDVVLSLDTRDPAAYARTIGASERVAALVVDNMDRCAELQRRHGYKLVVHCIVQPDDLDAAEHMLAHCIRHDIRICLSPLHVDYRVRMDAGAQDAYRAFFDRVIQAKRAGAPISGSYAFYDNVRSLAAYTCLPMLIPRILPTGDLLYPCRPRGHNAGNILEHGSWKAAFEHAVHEFGEVGRCTASCRIRCYIEPSLLMHRPLSMLREFA